MENFSTSAQTQNLKTQTSHKISMNFSQIRTSPQVEGDHLKITLIPRGTVTTEEVNMISLRWRQSAECSFQKTSRIQVGVRPPQQRAAEWRCYAGDQLRDRTTGTAPLRPVIVRPPSPQHLPHLLRLLTPSHESPPPPPSAAPGQQKML